MPTALISHPECRLHDTGPGHPECAGRIDAIHDQLLAQGVLDLLALHDAPLASRAQLLRVHDAAHLDRLERMVPENDRVFIDPDTPIGPKSLLAARRAAGAAVLAADLVVEGRAVNVFCNVRPPGHHATRDRAMGFCLLNNVAVGVAHALEVHGLERIAVFDFDVHHGNGTDEIFAADPRVLVASVFQAGLYPFGDHGPHHGGGVEAPVPAGAAGGAVREAVESRLRPALDDFRPQALFVSAGFDGHAADDLSGLLLGDDDYDWLTRFAMDVAARHAQGRIVSMLEGGYDLPALGRCGAAHVRRLAGI